MLEPRPAQSNPQLFTSRNSRRLTFCWALQFPPASFLARYRQAVVLVFLAVLLLPAGRESVLLRRAPALTLQAVLSSAGGGVSGDPVFHFPLLLLWEAGFGLSVSVHAHISVVDQRHGRPTHPSVAAAHTHAVFERVTALNLQTAGEGTEISGLKIVPAVAIVCSFTFFHVQPQTCHSRYSIHYRSSEQEITKKSIWISSSLMGHMGYGISPLLV